MKEIFEIALGLITLVLLWLFFVAILVVLPVLTVVWGIKYILN